jgi:hypothetical protein
MRRSRIKAIIRSTAIALIAFPEPVTTILGIFILCATLVAFQTKSLKKFGDPEVLIKKSIRNMKADGFSRYFGTQQSIENHIIKPDLPSQFQEISEKSKQTFAPANYNPWFDNRKVSEFVLHHTLKTSFPQYEAIPETNQKGIMKDSHPENIKSAITHHKLKLNLISETVTGSIRTPLN